MLFRSQLDLYSLNLDARVHIGSIGTIGGTALHQRNQSLGMKHPVPNYSQFNLGAFAYAEQEIVADVRATAALRYDTRAMDIAERRRSDSARSIINEAVSRSFTVTQAAVGFVWKPTSDFSTSLNISSGWRAPVAAELFSVGRDEGEIQYRVGNSNLRPERARNIEFAARYHSAHLVGDLTFFRQEIADYIYAVPTGATKENVPEYVYTQNNALLSGEIGRAHV